MVIKNEDNKVEMLITYCDCGCEQSLNIKRYKDLEVSGQPVEYYISFGTTKFSTEQMGIIGLIKTRLKRAWYSLIGKDFRYFDIVLTEQEFKEFCEKIQEM